MSYASAFVAGLIGGLVYQALFAASKVRQARRRGERVPPYRWLALAAFLPTPFAGLVTLWTLGHTNAPLFAANMTGVAWTALLHVAPFSPVASETTYAGEPTGEPRQTRVVEMSRRVLGWWSATRVSVLISFLGFIVALLTFLFRK